MSQPPRSSPVSSRRAPLSRATFLRGGTSPTSVTRTFSPAPLRLGGRWRAPPHAPSARRSASLSRRPRAGPARTRISASSCSWPRLLARPFWNQRGRIPIRNRQSAIRDPTAHRTDSRGWAFVARSVPCSSRLPWTTPAMCTRRFGERHQAGSDGRRRRMSRTSRR